MAFLACYYMLWHAATTVATFYSDWKFKIGLTRKKGIKVWCININKKNVSGTI